MKYNTLVERLNKLTLTVEFSNLVKKLYHYSMVLIGNIMKGLAAMSSQCLRIPS